MDVIEWLLEMGWTFLGALALFLAASIVIMIAISWTHRW